MNDLDLKDSECSTSDLKRKGSSLDDLPPKRSLTINVRYASSQTSSQTSQQLTRSQETEDSTVQHEEKFEKLNDFLTVCGVSPVKCMLNRMQDSSERTQRRYYAKANQCVSLVLDTIFGDQDSDSIKQHLFSEVENLEEDKESPEQFLQAVADTYMKAESWCFRRQLLSVVTIDFSFEEVLKYIPNLTRYRFYTAKKHMKRDGIGAPIIPQKQYRLKYEDSQLEHFIDFITSTNIIKDLPFGEKTLVLSTGEIIKTPNVIRSLAPASVVRQYQQLCKEQNMECLGESTLFKILQDCRASVRHSLEGLDYYVVEGGQAFSDLEDVIGDLDLTIQEKQQITSKLLAAKQYLKSEYKMHITLQSPVAYHCCSYALSDSSDFSHNPCTDHEHDQVCIDCKNLDDTLQLVLEKTTARNWDNQDAFLFKVENAISNICEWRCHIMRSKNQERAQRTITQCLVDGEAFIVGDWAMKFLPRKYREGQTDWFAKRGISWHISVVYLKGKHDTEISTCVHILEGPFSQDSSVTAAILVDTVASIHGISKINFWTDNAGCYKSSLTFSILHQELGSRLHSFNFCEAQAGKGVCDRKALHLKSSIKRYINEGQDVTCAADMKRAIDSQQHGQYLVKVVSPTVVLDGDKPIRSIPSITKFHNFVFDHAPGLTVWKTYEIGTGKQYPWDFLIQGKISTTPLRILFDANLGVPADVVESDTDSDNDETDEDVPDIVHKQRKVFVCPEEGCMSSFKTSSNLDAHLIVGCKNDHAELRSMPDMCKLKYCSKLSSGAFSSANSQLLSTEVEADNCTSPVKEMGWALKVHKPKTRFTEDQKQFLLDRFNAGKVTGRKEDPLKVAEEMRKEKRNGQNRFRKSEFLTSQQISSFFSRITIKEKKTDRDDVLAAAEEERLFLFKNEILKDLS